jgi:pyruvate dehydrogenase E1 component alpha subunit
VLEAGLLTEAELRALEQDVNQRVDEAVAFADRSPEPPLEWLLTDVYGEG